LLISSIGGCIFSCLVRPDIEGVGCSVALYGYFGGFLSFHLQNWNSLDKVYKSTSAKILNILFMVSILTIGLASTFSSIFEDRTAYIGSLILGFFFFFVITSPMEEDDGVCCSNMIWFWISIFMCISLYLIFFLVFYLKIKIMPSNNLIS
jgi:hypothetical protein